jgi:subtilisin family serine protease
MYRIGASAGQGSQAAKPRGPRANVAVFGKSIALLWLSAAFLLALGMTNSSSQGGEKGARRDASPVDEAALKAFNKAGQMVCVWAPKQGDAAVKAVQKLGLVIDLRDDDSGILICKWKGDLKKETLEALHKEAALDYVEPDPQVKLQGVGPQGKPGAAAPVKTPKAGLSVRRPNDPEFGQLYGMEMIRASTAWSTVQVSPVLVAVVDTGVDSNHIDLKGNVRTDLGIDFTRVDKNGRPTKNPVDENGHGTHVAGTIAAVGNNGVGVTGVCWRAKLVSLRVLDKDGNGSNARTAAGINAAVRLKARVINLSMAGTEDTKVLRDAVTRAEKANVLVVCAAGNVDEPDKVLDNDKRPMFAAGYKNANVIAVAAVGKNGALASFSHFGKRTVHLAAPGDEILSTTPGSKYGKLGGTSQATPHVAGAAALILGHPDHKNKGAAELRRLILANVRKTQGLKDKCVTGGILDIGFLARASNPPLVKGARAASTGAAGSQAAVIPSTVSPRATPRATPKQ